MSYKFFKYLIYNFNIFCSTVSPPAYTTSSLINIKNYGNKIFLLGTSKTISDIYLFKPKNVHMTSWFYQINLPEKGSFLMLDA